MYELWRQDDNGNTFLIGTFSDRRAAERLMAALTRGGHKQIYWITGTVGAPTRRPEGPAKG